jgi:hypothetical protein
VDYDIKVAIANTVLANEELRSPSNSLRAAADLFEKRNKDYGGAYKDFGRVLREIFPGGIILTTDADFGRFALFVLTLGKLHRYAMNFTKGGHSDSLTDLSVYAAMMKDLDHGA